MKEGWITGLAALTFSTLALLVSWSRSQQSSHDDEEEDDRREIS